MSVRGRDRLPQTKPRLRRASEIGGENSVLDGGVLDLSYDGVLSLDYGNGLENASTTLVVHFLDDEVLPFGDGSDYGVGYNFAADELRIVDGIDLTANIRLKLNSSGHFDFISGNIATLGDVDIGGTGAGKLYVTDSTREAFFCNGTAAAGFVNALENIELCDGNSAGNFENNGNITYLQAVGIGAGIFGVYADMSSDPTSATAGRFYDGTRSVDFCDGTNAITVDVGDSDFGSGTGTFGQIIDSGLTASLGVYTDASKQLTSTPPTTGVLGYWSRAGTVVSTATAGDDINVGGSAQLGDSVTDIHGINTAPVAGQMITGEFTTTEDNEDAIALKYTLNFNQDSTNSDMDVTGMEFRNNLNGTLTGSGSRDDINFFGMDFQIIDAQTFNGTNTGSEIIGINFVYSGAGITYTQDPTKQQFFGTKISAIADQVVGIGEKYGHQVNLTGGGAFHACFKGSAGGATENYFLYGEGSANNLLGGDSSKTFFGSEEDFEIFFDGSYGRLDATGDPIRIGDDTTNCLEVLSDGDVVFHGTAGLQFGSCYGTEIVWTQASAAQNTWYDISDSDMVSGPLNGVTHDGNGKLTVASAGMYMADWAGAFEASAANVHVQITFSINGTEANPGMNHFQTVAATREMPCSGNAILDLAASDTVNVSIRTTDAGTPNFTVDHLMIRLVQIGGT